MRTIHKYTIPDTVVPGYAFEIEMPGPSIVLHVDKQNGARRIWASVNPGQEVRVRKFVVLPTGGLIPDNAYHVWTWLEDGGAFVWHLFAVEEN